jgi:hypothetical protein
LDVARYADTHGIHFDNYREIWAYRDWVIDALNSNMPFDQFTIEQLAGDLLPNATVEQQIASGFNRCNITTNEGGVIPEEYLVLYTRDRTETVGQVWFGMTINCAVCHDHKFDPISQREFYELAAIFNNTTQGAMDGNIPNTPPILPLPQKSDRARFDALRDEVPLAREAVEQRKAESRPEFDQWLTTANPRDLANDVPNDALLVHASFSEGKGKSTNIQVSGAARDVPLADSAKWLEGPSGGSALAPQGSPFELPDAADLERTQPFTCGVWIKLPANDSYGAICSRMDNENSFRGWDFWCQRRQIGVHIVSRWADNALKVVAKDQIPGNQWTHVAVTYDGGSKASGIKVYYDGVARETNVEADSLSDSIRTPVPFKLGQRNSSEILSGAAIQDLRIYSRALSSAEIVALANSTQFGQVLAKSPAERTAAETDLLFGWWLGKRDTDYQEVSSKLQSLEKEQADILARGTQAHVMAERPEEAMAYILFRGEYDQRRDPVKPGTPQMLPPMPDDLPRDRLGFAQWLLRPEHPLTARVTVNRFWQQLFGSGIVRTSGDFGVAGELPTHPELLDWLAVEFRESGWDIKRFFKLLVMSSTYRQAAVTTAENLERDPDNLLLSRGPRFRLDAEVVRDYALAASGLLVPRIGGPSVKPYQPPGVWEAVAMIGSNTRDYVPDTGDKLYRRSLYTLWKRSAPPASMEIFNAPSRESCTVRRERTNTPLQALVTLNDPQFVEAARVLAERALREGGETTSAKLDFISLRLLARPLRPVEHEIVRESWKELTTYYQGHVDEAQQLIGIGAAKPAEPYDAATLAAWTMVVNQLMNLDEVLNK